jgi:NAD-dependent DNA ligase
MDEIAVPCRAKATKVTKAPTKVPSKPGKTQNRKQAIDFEDVIVVFTGFRNKDWEELIEAAGGKVGSSISGKTTLVVAVDPDENTTKLKKARALGIKIVSREQFEASL